MSTSPESLTHLDRIGPLLTQLSSRHCFRRASSRLLGSALSSQSISTVRSQCNITRRSIPRLSPRSPHIAALQVRWNSNKNDPSTSADQKEHKNEDVEAATQPKPVSSNLGAQQQPHKKAAQAPRVKIPPNETVYIGNLFYDITAEDLRKHMEKYGTVLNTMITHDNRGLSKGFGYVQFNTIEEATAAVEGMHSTILEGRHVVVHYARTHFNYKRASYPPTETLFIGSLPLEMTDRDLQDLFHDVKNLIDVRIPVDRRSGMPRGFAHAEFLNTEAAMQAMEILAMKRPYGRKLGVSFAERKRVGMMKPRPEPVDQEQAKAEAEARRRDRARREAEEAEEAERALEEEIASEKEAKLEDVTPVEGKKV
ncbi:uncharacterized protein N7473_012549 [Penicillium subrubescens]|uniref:uncharacterized protein n=1 Tax=Penicillium subrubescens TaxID=1316194 RepID=UPI002545A55B|nr:uncharacterized protein N7473_012549 [Penicillium subrubescens]KAJ5875202.1 hypothetical protein N7473_012549 [Penicillium subrubescens]